MTRLQPTPPQPQAPRQVPRSLLRRTLTRRVRGALALARVLGLVVLVEAALALTHARIPAPLRLSLPRLAGLLRLRLDLSEPPGRAHPAPDEPDGAAQFCEQVWAQAARVDRALALRPGRDTCLLRSLVLGRSLAGLDPTLDPVLRLGARALDGGRLEAHAWLEIDGRPFGDPVPPFVRASST